jgi:hypothetical protein
LNPLFGSPPLEQQAPQAAKPVYFFFAALSFAHLALCAAAIRFLPAIDIVRFGFGARPFAFAQRAFCARLIRLRAKADMVCCLGLVELRPPPNLPRTERAASTCRSSFTKLVLTVFNFDTNDDSPVRFAISAVRLKFREAILTH